MYASLALLVGVMLVVLLLRIQSLTPADHSLARIGPTPRTEARPAADTEGEEAAGGSDKQEEEEGEEGVDHYDWEEPENAQWATEEELEATLANTAVPESSIDIEALEAAVNASLCGIFQTEMPRLIRRAQFHRPSPPQLVSEAVAKFAQLQPGQTFPPGGFLPNHKNPCWKEKLKDGSGDSLQCLPACVSQ